MRSRVLDLRFVKDGENAWKVCFAKSARGLCRVLRDTKYPEMWRVERPNGTLTDMVNLARAKDAAWGMAEGVLFVEGRIR